MEKTTETQEVQEATDSSMDDASADKSNKEGLKADVNEFSNTTRSNSKNDKSDTVMPRNDSNVNDDQTSSQPEEEASDRDVFRITRPQIIRNADSATTENCVTKKQCDYSITANLNQAGIQKTVNTNTILRSNVQVVPGCPIGKWSANRNKQSLIPCNNHSAILLPRPQNSCIPGYHIQRMPVLNNTHFQLPKNTPINTGAPLSFVPIPVENKGSGNCNFQTNHVSARSTLTTPDVAINTTQRQKGKHPSADEQGNTFDPLKIPGKKEGITREDTDNIKSLDNIYKERKTYDPNSKDTNKVNGFPTFTNITNESKLNNQEIYHNPFEDHTIVKDDTCASNSSTGSLNLAVQRLVINGDNDSDITNHPSTSRCHTGELNSEIAAGDEEQVTVNLTGSMENVTSTVSAGCHLDMLELVDINDEADTSEKAMKDLKERKSQESDNLSDLSDINVDKEHKVPIKSSKGRKRPHHSNKMAEYTNTDKVAKKERKKSYVLKNKFAHKLHKRKEREIKQSNAKQLLLKNSKTFQDIESRYIGEESKDVTSFEKVFEDKCDIINKVESEKLTKVKDHHLLTLSDEEREYLRNKCYLEDELTIDVRRRFENYLVRKQRNREGYSMNMDLPKTNKPCLIAKTSISNSDLSHNDTESSEESISVVKEIPINEEPVEKRQFNISIKQPVVRLERLNCIPKFNQELLTEKPKTQQNNRTTEQMINQPSTSRKVYYVVNSADINKLKKPTVRTKEANGFQKGLSVYPAILPNTAAANAVSERTTAQQPSAIITQSTSCLPQKISLATNSNVVIVDRQTKPQESLLIPKDSSDKQKFNQNGQVPVKAYSNKVTVKKLLEAKREDRKGSFEVIRPVNKLKTTSSLQVNVVERHHDGLVKNLNVTSNINATSVHSQIPTCGFSYISSAVVSGTSSGNPLINIFSTSLQRNISASGTQTQLSGNIKIVNPPLLKPITSKQSLKTTASPFLSSKMLGNSASQSEVKSSSNVINNVALQSENEKRKPIYIKIGEQTMVVKRSEEKRDTKRKTLPAPKPKRTIADDYKRKRRPSRDRTNQAGRHKSLKSSLRKVLKESQQSIYKLMNCLDLVPVELLKQFTGSKKREERMEKMFEKQDDFNSTTPANENREKDEENVANEPPGKESLKQRRSKICNMANIVQISKQKDGNVNFSCQQIDIRYRNPELKKRQIILSTHLGIPCRLQFSDNGCIEKMYADTLQQGLYLVENANPDNSHLKENMKLSTSLILYPPHIATIPNDSLSIAVGDIYNEEDKNQYRIETGRKNIHITLDEFLSPFAIKNIDEFMDKRYCSVTEKSMSPRYCSKKFYSEEMREAFDWFENKSCCADSTKNVLTVTRKGETSFAKFDLQSTRFSERAIALKIKQNELFESCRRLKSDQAVKEGYKRKRPRIDAPKRDNENNDFDAGVRVLNDVQDIFRRENRSAESAPQEDAGTIDNVIVLDVE